MKQSIRTWFILGTLCLSLGIGIRATLFTSLKRTSAMLPSEATSPPANYRVAPPGSLPKDPALKSNVDSAAQKL